LLVWYTIITAAFRCPSSLTDVNDSSPGVCKPYLQVRSQVEPYVKPYYDIYVALYVEKAQPYTQKFNDQVYAPSSKFAKQSYEIYGAPRVNQARSYSEEQWQKIVLPQLVAAQVQINDVYGSSIAPHVDKISAVAGPYYGTARDNALKIHKEHILPAYAKSKPYIYNAYSTGHHLAVETGLPYIQQTWTSVVLFVDETMWPKLRHLYSENVEPQLLKIGDRLAKYREGGEKTVVSDSAER
jgi:hypothetical protein